MVDLFRHWHLQLIGRRLDQLDQPGAGHPGEPIGSRLFLQPGTFRVSEEHLGITHPKGLPLPLDAISCRDWLLDGYQFWDAPQGGVMELELSLHQAMPLDSCLLSLPPFLIRLDSVVQPTFSVYDCHRNPCPAWTERVFVYEDPAQPFQATAIAYLDGEGAIAAAEIFDVETQAFRGNGTIVRRRKLWVSYALPVECRIKSPEH